MSKINQDIEKFFRKIEPEFAKLINQKIVDSKKNVEVLTPAQLTIDVTDKMQEWFDLIKTDKTGTQLEIEVLTSLSARLMLLWWVREKTIEKQEIITNGEVI